MLLTNATAGTFVNGQMEIQNDQEGYIFRGEIAEAVVFKGELMVRFSWLAKGEGYPPVPTRWVNNTDLDYQASLEIYNVSDIGDGRLALQCPSNGELAILFPPDGSKLDPAIVEGLVIAGKHMYQSVEAWLEAEHQDLLGLFRNPGPSQWWRRAIANEMSDEELSWTLQQEAISEMLMPGAGTTSATYRWCSALRDAREAGKLPRPTQ